MKNRSRSWSIGMGVGLVLLAACTTAATDAQVPKPATVREQNRGDEYCLRDALILLRKFNGRTKAMDFGPLG